MPAPMDFMAHELHDPMASPSMQGNATSDVVAMQNMLAAVCMARAPCHDGAPSARSMRVVPHRAQRALTGVVHPGRATGSRAPAGGAAGASRRHRRRGRLGCAAEAPRDAQRRSARYQQLAQRHYPKRQGAPQKCGRDACAHRSPARAECRQGEEKDSGGSQRRGEAKGRGAQRLGAQGPLE